MMRRWRRSSIRSMTRKFSISPISSHARAEREVVPCPYQEIYPGPSDEVLPGTKCVAHRGVIQPVRILGRLHHCSEWFVLLVSRRACCPTDSRGTLRYILPSLTTTADHRCVGGRETGRGLSS